MIDKKPTTKIVLSPEARKAIRTLERLEVEKPDKPSLTNFATTVLKMALFEVGWPKWHAWEILRKAAVK